MERPAVTEFEENDKGHGRVEQRTVRLSHDLSWLTTTERWPGLAYVAQVTRETTVLATDKTSKETVYYIGSDSTVSAESAGSAIRRHWAVESKLHWVLMLPSARTMRVTVRRILRKIWQPCATSHSTSSGKTLTAKWA